MSMARKRTRSCLRMLLTALEDNLVEHSFLRILLYELRF